LTGNKKRAAKSDAQTIPHGYSGMLVQMDPVAQLGLLYCWHRHPPSYVQVNTWKQGKGDKCNFAGKKRKRFGNVF
jgi:hypothetical protein